MSRLQELIDELCPNGVEYKQIREIAWTGIGLATSVTKYKRENGVVLLHNSDIKQNKIEIKNREFLDETFVGKNANKVHQLYDIITVHTGDVGTSAVIEEEHVGSIGFTTIITRINDLNEVYPYYLAHYLNSQLFKNEVNKKSISDRNNLNQKDFEVIYVPIPPIDIQKEIVNILDKYTAVAEEIKRKLEEELVARKKQYMYLTSELIDKVKSENIVDLEEVCGVYDGTHSTPQYTESGVRFVSVENINNLYESPKFISEEAYEKFKIKPQIGDVFMTRIGTMGKCAVVDRDEPLGYYVSLALLRPNKDVLSSEYLRWYLESGSGWKELEARTLWNATPIKINKGEIGKMKIKVPSLAEQKTIVEKISAYYDVNLEIINCLSQEIELRKKQYEYYRDKLLSFKEKEVVI